MDFDPTGGEDLHFLDTEYTINYKSFLLSLDYVGGYNWGRSFGNGVTTDIPATVDVGATASGAAVPGSVGGFSVSDHNYGTVEEGSGLVFSFSGYTPGDSPDNFYFGVDCDEDCNDTREDGIPSWGY